MNVEDELTQALRSESSSTPIAPGDLAAVARRGQQRNRVRTGVLACAAVVLVGAGASYAISRPASDTVIDTAGQSETLGEAEGEPAEDATDDEPIDESEHPITTLPPTEGDAGDQADTDIQSILESIASDNLCELEDPSPHTAEVISVSTMSDGTRIANVVCRLGAYQATDVRLFAIDDQFDPVLVEWFDGSAVTTESLLYGFVDIDEAEDALSLFVRYRGAGDCGVGMTHRWDAQQGLFALTTAHGVTECPDVVAEITPSDWPQIYPAPVDAPLVVEPTSGQLVVSDECRSDDLSRRRDDLLDDAVVNACLEEVLRANTAATQIWIEDVIDDGDRTLVVWRAVAFEGDPEPGSPWGFEELHVTDLVTWTDQLVQRLDWDGPDDADWMYAERVEFADGSTLRVMVAWRQGECYWVDHVELSGERLALPDVPYARPAEPAELAADPSRCLHDIDDVPMIESLMFRSSEGLAYLQN